MDWGQMMVFDAAGSSYFAYSHEGVLDDGTRSYLVDADPSSYCYGSGPWWISRQMVIFLSEYMIKYPNGLTEYYPSYYTPPGDYYSTKKLVKDLGLPVEKIDACKNGCMLYWNDDIDLEYCTFCWTLGASLPEDETYSGRSLCMLPLATCRLVPVCREEPHNVRLGLRIESFAPHAYNHAKDRAFIMRAVLIWTVNNLPAYDIASGWSTAGLMGCPICMDDTRAFHLQQGRKACYFDCH
ncbi:UNVERIFIED_CONTAM: hypothetical protein Scaly_1927100, partial [Sesamum calycinum]